MVWAGWCQLGDGYETLGGVGDAGYVWVVPRTGLCRVADAYGCCQMSDGCCRMGGVIRVVSDGCRVWVAFGG